MITLSKDQVTTVKEKHGNAREQYMVMPWSCNISKSSSLAPDRILKVGLWPFRIPSNTFLSMLFWAAKAYWVSDKCCSAHYSSYKCQRSRVSHSSKSVLISLQVYRTTSSRKSSWICYRVPCQKPQAALSFYLLPLSAHKHSVLLTYYLLHKFIT